MDYEDIINEMRARISALEGELEREKEKRSIFDININRNKISCPICGKSQKSRPRIRSSKGIKRQHYYFLECCGKWELAPRKHRPQKRDYVRRED